MLMLTLALVLSADGCSKRTDCALDEATKTCRLAQNDREREGGPIDTSGTTCVCEDTACKPFTVEPVACRSWRDCSLAWEPFLHPVSSKKTKRSHNRPVRPCKDSEHDSVCDKETKTCRVVSWKC